MNMTLLGRGHACEIKDLKTNWVPDQQGGPSREAQHQKEHVEMEMGMRDSTTSQDARSPGSWTSQKGTPRWNPRRERHPCPQTSGWERRDFCCFRPHRIWSFSTAAP